MKPRYIIIMLLTIILILNLFDLRKDLLITNELERLSAPDSVEYTCKHCNKIHIIKINTHE